MFKGGFRSVSVSATSLLFRCDSLYSSRLIFVEGVAPKNYIVLYPAVWHDTQSAILLLLSICDNHVNWLNYTINYTDDWRDKQRESGLGIIHSGGTATESKMYSWYYYYCITGSSSETYVVIHTVYKCIKRVVAPPPQYPGNDQFKSHLILRDETRS